MTKFHLYLLLAYLLVHVHPSYWMRWIQMLASGVWCQQWDQAQETRGSTRMHEPAI